MTGPSAGVSTVTQARVYVSFDIDHDRELYERLLAESGGSSFCVSGRSEFAITADALAEQVRDRIREADEVIVICGEHTEASPYVSAELRIAQEERTPYFLLWGRRGMMCTKPVGAKSSEGMYKWTREILEDQVAIALRRARALAPTPQPS
jgi:Thoeris protein ThsB, TIR-like domain